MSDLNYAAKFWQRPDGVDSGIYKTLVEEGRHRLAWEFLIRNAEFQYDCQAVRMGYAEATVIASAWGLYRFKPFYEPYSSHRKPRFLVSKVSLFRAKPDQPVRKIRVRPGEIAFLLDIDRMVHSFDSRDAQIAKLTSLVDATIEWRRSRRNITPVPKARVNETHLDACLQVADLLNSNHQPSEIKSIVAYLQFTQNEGNTAHTRYRDMKHRLDRLISNQGYVELAARAHAKKTPTAASTIKKAQMAPAAKPIETKSFVAMKASVQVVDRTSM